MDTSILSGKKPFKSTAKLVVLPTKTKDGWQKQAKTHGQKVNQDQKDGRKKRHNNPPRPKHAPRPPEFGKGPQTPNPKNPFNPNWDKKV